jgi:tripartite-type tricarboxylate transporter receptor subunit TctC
MKTFLRRVLKFMAIAAMASGGSGAFAADTFPDRPITISISTAPGGGVDITARALAKQLSAMWKQPVLIQNAPGAGGIVAANQVIKSAPDGYHLLLGHSGDISATPFLFDRPDYQPLKQLTPLSQILLQPYAVVVNPSVPAKTLAELIAWIKKKNATGEKVASATGALGGPEHLSTEELAIATGLDVLIVPYKSAGPALVDIIAGQIPFGFFSIATAGAQVKAGQLRMLAVGAEQRAELFPDVPTVAETLPGFTAYAYYGMFGPAEMPKALADRISKDVRTAVASSEMQALMRSNGQTAATSTPAEFMKFLEEDSAQTSAYIKKAGIRLQ